ncbi:site-specific integrase [Streptomyces virginiae]|uniref:site-specific integrase n=1 Tax=Streptomyces virginiae TaxID=1961 RepID=UPI0036573469
MLCNTASRPSWPLAPSTVRSYVRKASPCLHAWNTAGIDDLRAITTDHIQQQLAPLLGEARKSLLGALRSLFRALKREKLIFRDPTRKITLTTARALPRPLTDDQLAGAVDRLPFIRDQLSLALAAVHALSVHDQRGLRLDDLTQHLITRWLAERHRRWPASTNPHLLVTAQTSADDTHPKVNPQAINKPLGRIGLQASRLRTDRILDEAKHTADPVRLIQLFGLSPTTAMRYVRAAHPERFGRGLSIAP